MNKQSHHVAVLGASPKLSAIMPCSWSVYELADGSVWDGTTLSGVAPGEYRATHLATP